MINLIIQASKITGFIGGICSDISSLIKNISNKAEKCFKELKESFNSSSDLKKNIDLEERDIQPIVLNKEKETELEGTAQPILQGSAEAKPEATEAQAKVEKKPFGLEQVVGSFSASYQNAEQALLNKVILGGIVLGSVTLLAKANPGAFDSVKQQLIDNGVTVCKKATETAGVMLNQAGSTGIKMVVRGKDVARASIVQVGSIAGEMIGQGKEVIKHLNFSKILEMVGGTSERLSYAQIGGKRAVEAWLRKQ